LQNPTKKAFVSALKQETKA